MPPGLGPLPIVVGVTGHRDLRPHDHAALRTQVGGVFAHLRTLYPHTPLVVLSSLAEGADRLAADEGLAAGARLHVPLPMPKDDYLTDFPTAESRAEFERLLGRAESVFVVTADGHPGSRTDGYDRAGKFVATHSQVLVALWDGSDGGKPGGTAEIVRWRLDELPRESASALLPPDPVRTGPVVQVVTPRAGDPPPADPLAVKRHLPAGDGLDAEYRRMGKEIDAFNAEAAGLSEDERAAAARGRGYLWPDDDLSPGLLLTREVMAAADQLAVRYRRRVGHTLKAVCALVFLAVVAYEVTGHLLHVQHVGLLVYPALLGVAYLVYRVAKRGQYQSRYLDYRALAEGLRVQFYWRLADVREPVDAHYLRRQRRELNWIRVGLRIAWGLQGGELPPPAAADARRQRERVRHHWVEDQRKFFARRAPMEERNERLGHWFIRGCVGLALVLSVLVGVLLTFPAAFGPDVEHWLHDYPWAERLLMLWTSLPLVVAAVTHAYRRAVELKAHAKQYEVMAHLFADAHAKLETAADADVPAILQELGDEALVENGDWVLMNRARPMEVPTGR